MTNYAIHHTCGHSVDTNLTGNCQARDNRAAWLAKQPCMACVRASEAATAAAGNQAQGLPALTGSEKQIVWAEQLRCEAMRRATAAATTQAAGQHESLRDDLEAMAARIISRQVSAKWWIDQRHGLTRVLSLLATPEDRTDLAAIVAKARAAAK